MRVDRAALEQYSVKLLEPSRPPSKGGNAKAWHQHRLLIDGETYSFRAPWRGKFVFSRERVSFDWDWDSTNTYRNADLATVVAWTVDGEEVRRGERETKKWRAAETRLPAGRREWKD